VFEHEEKSVKVKLNEVTRRSDFKRAMKDIDIAYTQTLDEISGVCLNAGAREIAVVLAGGGANYPFLQSLARRARPAKGKVRLKVEPLVPEWASSGAFGESLAAVFPQLSIAIGGAIAPPVFVRQRHGQARAMVSA